MAPLAHTTTGSRSVTAPSPERLLRLFLDDHWAGSGGAVALADRMAANNPAPPWDGPIGRLRDHVVDDDRTLGTVRRVIAVDGGGWKRRAAVAAERVGRLKLNGRVAGYSPLSRVHELELMTAHLVASRALWQVLRRLDDPRLAGVDLAGLELRAEVQLSALHDLHTRAVDEAFGLRPAGAPG